MTSAFRIPPLDLSSRRHYRWGQLYGCSYGLAVRKAALSVDSPMLVLVSGNQVLDELLDQLHFFQESEALPVLSFPDWETLPYDTFSPHQDIVSRRLETLYALPSLKRGLVITTTATAMQRIAPAEFVQSNALILNRGDQLDLERFKLQLDAAGYYSVPKVTQHGEFAVRGSLIDLFPTGNDRPFRIDLFDDEIDSIKLFDEETQISIEETESIRMLPAREYPLDEQGITRFRQGFRREFEGNPKECPIYNDISDGFSSAGAEYYLPLFFEHTETLFDYLPENITIISLDDALSESEDYYEQVIERYEVHRHDPERPILPPSRVFLTPDDFVDAYDHLNRIDLQHYTHEQENRITTNFSTSAVPEVKVNARSEDPAFLLKQFIQNFSGNILLTAESPGQREMLLELLNGFGIRPEARNSWQDFIDNPEKLCLTVAPFSEGVQFHAQSIAIITDQQILGQRSRQLSSRRRQRQAESVFSDLGELHIGSPVVHEEQGVGRYLGLQTLHVNEYAEEFLALEYADNDKLYVPVTSLHLINRYTGGPEETAPLHRLGSEQWQKAKRRAREKIRDVAAELLEIYARRAAKPGYAYPFDHIEYEAFAESFPFEETEDQHNAIQAVIEDMQANTPMDRVVCGDVGFGKTEVAMRAAFIAAQAGKQVAILTPTTLLTQQHYQNFGDRFADWPIKVDVLSRFRSNKETRQTLALLADGKIDIIIGTHKLLQKDVCFNNLGLLIIDEEHRFGVRQKEQLKKMRSEVDMLTLTATPIPRTLNMSLSGLRDLSIIATPPLQRLSVKTFVNEWRDLTVQEACFREIKRGGQVYFLHNDVGTIEKMAEDLRELVPQARVEVAHGQMRERELENVMLDFYHRRFNILVCTTIIESGIDVATANTIVMNRADKLGLAQLHQLRGRVGRSHHQAYAYLIVPPRKAMSADAVKRVEAVESLEDLGAGFSLASHDLEIRGSGELLGEGQSGQISEIGFTLYTDLLNRAVTELKSGRTDLMLDKRPGGPEIELHIPALLPDDYIPDVHIRLVLYKRIDSAEDNEASRELQVELIDRFGNFPEAVHNLFAVNLLKRKARTIGIERISANDSGGRIVFMDQPDIDPIIIINLIQQAPQTYQFDGKNTLRFSVGTSNARERIDLISQLLETLTAKKAA